jgi:hypothetical protein
MACGEGYGDMFCLYLFFTNFFDFYHGFYKYPRGWIWLMVVDFSLSWTRHLLS